MHRPSTRSALQRLHAGPEHTRLLLQLRSAPLQLPTLLQICILTISLSQRSYNRLTKLQ
jgi:hypothetical protein